MENSLAVVSAKHEELVVVVNIPKRFSNRQEAEAARDASMEALKEAIQTGMDAYRNRIRLSWRKDVTVQNLGHAQVSQPKRRASNNDEAVFRVRAPKSLGRGSCHGQAIYDALGSSIEELSQRIKGAVEAYWKRIVHENAQHAKKAENAEMVAA